MGEDMDVDGDDDVANVGDDMAWVLQMCQLKGLLRMQGICLTMLTRVHFPQLTCLKHAQQQSHLVNW